MSGQGRVSRAGRTSGWAGLEGRPLTDHKETKVDHWRIQETGRCADLMARGKRFTSPG